MSEERSINKQAAILFRPLPDNVATGNEPVKFGGKPRLPAEIEWPRQGFSPDSNASHLHFVAEIDLARLPRKIGNLPMPTMPDMGTIFIFLPLNSDAIYGCETAEVRYWPDGVVDVPEREPPADLPKLIGDDFDGALHVNQDGTTNGGRLLVRKTADALAFASTQAANPLATNMSEAQGIDVSDQRKAIDFHHVSIAKTLLKARTDHPFPKPPEYSVPTDFLDAEELHKTIPDGFLRFNHTFEPRHLDWEFIFDWAKAFYFQCFGITLGHYKEMQEAGYSGRILKRRIRKLKEQRSKVKNIDFGQGHKPLYRFYNFPAKVGFNFDYQAKRWISLARFEGGYAANDMLNAFVDMLKEIDRHGNAEDDEGYSLDLRIGLLDHRVSGHDKHAGNMLVAAKEAFKIACQKADKRHASVFEQLLQSDRWDSRIIHASNPVGRDNFSMGTMPLQMFGLGFEIQSAVSDHADDILLFQIGDSFGLPIEFGPDMIVQLWISPEDLATGRFDRISMTQDMS